MLREIIKTKSKEYILHIPKEYLNKRIEILVLPLDDNSDTSRQLISNSRIESNNKNKQMKDDKKLENIVLKTSGLLKNRNIDPVKWQKNIRKDWD